MGTESRVNISALGLDVGTSRICLAQREGDEFRYQTQLNAFVSIPYSKITGDVLKKEQVPHTLTGSEIIVHGNESDRFADLLNVETRRTMDRGVLNPSEPESLAMLRKIVASLVPPSHDHRKACFTVPAAPLGAEENLTYHEATLRQILTDLGYDVKSINEGLAVIYSELESSNYTGIGISCGGGLCNVCVAYLSVPVLSFSIPKAGDYIDTNTAVITGERANRVRMAKEESFHFNGFFADKLQQVLSVYYDEMIQSLVQGMKQGFANSRTLFKSNRPLPIVLSGGTALPAGFLARFEKMLLEAELPIATHDIRMAADPLHASAKGALVAALADS
ncbi:MAG TPA: hypothetical protein VMH80_11145 [Bryobacteraceae bacterium]|nr:hypothetical protein [Bryobacteraceae bacterium]